MSTPFWLRHVDQNKRSAVTLPAKTEVLVIGGGFSGVSTAYWLCNNNITDVTVLEKSYSLAGGATGRNGGHLWPGIECPLSEEVERQGEKEAIKLWQFTNYNFESVKKFVEENNINCELRVNGSVVLAKKKQGEKKATDNEEWQKIQADYNFLKIRGLAEEMELWDEKKCAKEMKNDLFWGGLFTTKAAQVWPAKLVWGISEKCTSMGAKFYTSVEVLSVTRAGDRYHVKTSVGEISAKYVVYATNAYTGQLLPQFSKAITPVRGQAIATSPLPKNFPFGYLTNFGYEYWVQQPDGRVVLGGMRWKSKDMEVGKLDTSTTNDDVSKGLHEFINQLYPSLPPPKVEHEWTGIMGFSLDGKPLVGPIAGMENSFMLAGFTGHGMPLIFGCGEAVAAMITKKERKSISPNNATIFEIFPNCLLPSRFEKRSKL